MSPAEQVIAQVLASKNHFQVLEVDQDCDNDTMIRKAYLMKSMKCHPDKCSHENATMAFQKLAEAYEIIGTVEKRTEYRHQLQFGGSDGGFGAMSEEFGVEVDLEEALHLFQTFVMQFNEQQQVSRENNMFDVAASILKSLDSISGSSKSRDSTAENETEQVSTLSWLASVASGIGTAYHVYKSLSDQAEREKNEDAERNSSYY